MMIPIVICRVFGGLSTAMAVIRMRCLTVTAASIAETYEQIGRALESVRPQECESPYLHILKM